MKNNLFYFYLICFLCLTVFLTSCHSTKTDSNIGIIQTEKEINYYSNTPKEEFEEKEYNISLKANATTGYSWNYAIKEGNDIIICTMNKYNPFPSQGMVGTGGEQQYTFVSKKPGKAVIEFYYSRPWETKEPVEKRSLVLYIAENGDITDF